MDTDLDRAVWLDICEQGDYKREDMIRYMENVMYGGCASGVVSDLIATADCHDWFDRFYDDIEYLRQVMQEQLGEPITPKEGMDLKTFYAWFSYEETLRGLYEQMEDV